jgi:hypothetical protein
VDPQWLAKNPGQPTTREDTFALSVDRRLPTPVATASRSGWVAQAPLVPSGEDWTTAGELILQPGPGSDLGCLGWHEVHYRQLTITRDGAGIRGTIKGGAAFRSGDVVAGVALDGTFVGTRDVAPPVPSLAEQRPHPADPLTVRLDEAVAADTSAFLVAGDGTRRPLVPSPEREGPRAAFILKEPVGPLADLRLVFQPGLVDLAGNAARDLSLPIEPLAVPLLPEDGFEGSTPPYLLGGAVMVGGPGERAVYVPAAAAIEPGVAARVSFRLRVGAGARVVRMTVKGAFVGAARPGVLLPIAVIAPTGATSKLSNIAVNEPFTRQGSLNVSGPTPVELPLPEGVKDQVLIDVNRLLYTCGGPSPEISGAYIDDVRVE